MPTLAATIHAVLAGVWSAIAVFAGGRVLVPANRADRPPTQEDYDRHKLRTEYWVTVYKRVVRLNERFQRLFTRWQTNTLPKPRKSCAGQARAQRKPYLRLPTRLGWLNRAVPGISPSTGLLERTLRHPDLPAFLQAAPQAMRLLRPLCRMLGLKPPPKPTPKPAQPPEATAPSTTPQQHTPPPPPQNSPS